MKADLEARRKRILQIVINTYISSGNPVSSRTICAQYRLGLCPASVRNVMADLEEQGLIMHQHTSAGRIPTDKGYRFYVDKLIAYAGLSSEEQLALSKEYISRQIVFEEVIRKTSKVLSDFTHYAGVVSLPEIKRSKFKKIQFVILGAHKICVTLITNTGITKSSVVYFDFEIDKDKLKRIENFMNEQLENTLLTQVKTKLRKMMIEERDSFFHIMKQASDMIDMSSLMDEKMSFYLEGISNILSLPEFENSGSVRSIMKAIDEKMALSALIEEVFDDNAAAKVKVFIGKENQEDFMSDCAVVLTGYKVDDQIIGGLGIIGPRRMDYEKAIAAVQYVSGILNDILSRFSV